MQKQKEVVIKNKAHNIKGEYRLCRICKDNFWAYRYKIKQNQAKYCSQECSGKAMIGKKLPPGVGFQKGHGGIPRSYAKGKEHHRWKENVTYTHLHDWVRKEKGKPKTCEWCSNPKGRIEWANVSRTYERNLNDYIALCSSCHGKHDKKMKRKEL